jgi:hypothetical protein
MGAEGRRRALREFDERRLFATVLAEYERLLREKGLPVPLPVRAEPALAAVNDITPTPVVAGLAAVAGRRGVRG